MLLCDKRSQGSFCWPCNHLRSDWKSFTLNAENQAAATAAEAVEFAKTFWRLVQDPTADSLGPAVRHAPPSALAIDAKSLYDSVKKESAMHGAACKRTAAELQVLRQTLRHRTTVSRRTDEGQRTTVARGNVATADVPFGVWRFVHRR